MSKFDDVCAAHGGTPLKKRDTFKFDRESGLQAIAALGFTCTLPDRPVALAWLGNGKVVAEIAKEDGDDFAKAGWVEEAKRWYLVLGTLKQAEFDPEKVVEEHDLDNRFRCLELDRNPAGWAASKANGDWMRKVASSIKMMMMAALSMSRADAESLMGALEADPWKLVFEPLRPEYPEPGSRKWNHNAPRLRCEPVEGPTPTWDMVEAHLMREADGCIPQSLKAVGITTGGQYLRAWAATIIRDPLLRLPYLFFFGDENNGKSSYWEAFAQFIVEGGVVKADRALTSKSDFNGELEGCILAVIEEKDITRADGSLNKIKDAVTGLTLSIRRMRQDSYHAPNFTHWMHMANDINSAHLYHGASRFCCFHVEPLANEIPKFELFERLAAEAPAYTFDLLNMRLPAAEGRLRLPTIETPSYRRACDANIPDWVVALADYVTEAGSFSGTLKQLGEHVELPHDMRPVTRALTMHKTYLSGRKIGYLIGEKGKHGKTITLKAAA